MNKGLLGFCIILVLVCSSTEQTGLIDAIKKEAQKISATFPPKYTEKIKNLQGSSSMVTDYVETKNIDLLKKKYSLPSDVFKKIQGIAFSKSVTIQSFNVAVTPNSARREEYIGAGYKENGIVKFAYIKSIVYGAIVPQYDSVKRRKCKKILFVKWCKTKTKYIQRGNNAAEIDIIKSALKAQAYTNLNAKINSINSDTQLILTEGQELHSMKNSKKAIIVPSTGQVFVGATGFTPDKIKKASNFGKLLGSVRKSKEGPFNLELKNNGALSVKNKSGGSVWNAFNGNKGTSPYQLIVTDSGDLLLSDSNWTPLYSSNSKYTSKQFVLLEEYRYYSENGKYYVQIQRDGDIMLYQEMNGSSTDKVIWSTDNNVETGPFALVIESNGNMKILDGNWKSIWETKKTTKVPGPHKLKVTNEGVLQVLDGRNGIIWKSK